MSEDKNFTEVCCV